MGDIMSHRKKHYLSHKYSHFFNQNCRSYGAPLGVLHSFIRNLSHLPELSGEGNGTPLQYSCLENPMDEEPGRLQSMGSLRVGHN